MSHRKTLAVVAGIFLVCVSGSAPRASASVRDTKRLGAIATYDTNSQLVGPGIGVNPMSWFRLEASYLVPSSSPRKFTSTLQTTGKFLISDWDTSPYAGLGSGPQTGQLAVVVGLDYTSLGGFNVGGGYSRVSTAGASSVQIYGGYYY